MRNCICIDVEDPARVSVTKLVRARRPWSCVECGESIKVGRLYEHTRGIWTDFVGWQSFRTCARCVNVRSEYFNCGWEYGGVREAFRETFGFDYVDGIPEGFAPCGTVTP
jgi:hypothetical protein